jgi:hypothetical protein
VGGVGYYESIAYNVPVAVGDNLMEYALTPFNYPSGRLYGDVVNDANNQGISNAVVLLISSTGTTRLTYTGGGSQFDFYNLPYDLRYTLVGRAAGFQPGQVRGIEVPAFNEIYVRLPLNAGNPGLVGRLVLQGFSENPAGSRARTGANSRPQHRTGRARGDRDLGRLGRVHRAQCAQRNLQGLGQSARLAGDRDRRCYHPEPAADCVLVRRARAMRTTTTSSTTATC